MATLFSTELCAESNFHIVLITVINVTVALFEASNADVSSPCTTVCKLKDVASLCSSKVKAVPSLGEAKLPLIH